MPARGRQVTSVNSPKWNDDEELLQELRIALREEPVADDIVRAARDTLDWLATSSGVITAGQAEREAGRARSRAALTARSADGRTIEMPLRSWCWQAGRLPR